MKSEDPAKTQLEEPVKSLFRDHPDWKDVEPIYHSPHEDAVVRIAMTDEFIDAFAYLRAMMQKNELSERSFQLTTVCTQQNAANYSVWQFRRNILRALNKDLRREFEFCEETAYENPKNYQVWHHRRVLVEWMNDAGGELEFTRNALGDDSKNYHAWQHRQWVVEKFDLFNQAEMDYTLELLREDVRNNSAWNYRYFIFGRLSDGFKPSEALDKEIRFTLQCIQKLPGNESPWSYLAGILLNEGQSSRDDVAAVCQELYASKNPSIHLRSFMVDSCVERIEKKLHVDESVKEAFALLDELKTIDPIRSNFWDYQTLLVENLQNAGDSV